jgi:hypothetical protein
MAAFAGQLYRESLLEPHDNPTGIISQLLERTSLKTWSESFGQYEINNDTSNKALFELVNNIFRKQQLRAPIEVSIDLKNNLQHCGFVVSATSQGHAFIDPTLLADQAIVCDAARPPDVRRDINAKRNNVLVFEGGLLHLPENIRFGKDNVIGLPDGINLACLSETIALAFTRPTRNYSIGLDVPLSEAKYIFDTAMTHGFEIALMDSNGNLDVIHEQRHAIGE